MESDLNNQQVALNKSTSQEQITGRSISNQKGFIPIILGVIVLLIIVGGGAYYLGNKSKQVSTSIQSTTTPTSVANTPTPSLSSNNNTKDSTITLIDSIWNKYTDYKLGFSINIPKLMSPFSGGCKWNTSENSYRPERIPVPVKTFEEGNFAFISHEYYYQLEGERKVTQGYGTVSYFDRCDKVMNSLALLENSSNSYESKWKITVDTVNNDDELNSFIQNQYGTGCSLGEKKQSEQNGAYDIKIKRDGKDLGETKCPLNYIYVLKYYPTQYKVASWVVGQACVFMSNNDCLDPEMIKSFRFE